MEEMAAIFGAMGFGINEGFDIETDWFNFTALMLAASACAVGNGLVYNSSSGYWVVATSANRTAAWRQRGPDISPVVVKLFEPGSYSSTTLEPTSLP